MPQALRLPPSSSEHRGDGLPTSANPEQTSSTTETLRESQTSWSCSFVVFRLVADELTSELKVRRWPFSDSQQILGRSRFAQLRLPDPDRLGWPDAGRSHKPPARAL